MQQCLRSARAGCSCAQALEAQTNSLFDAFMTNNHSSMDNQGDWGVMIMYVACWCTNVCPPFDLPNFTSVFMKASRDRHLQKFTERVLPKRLGHMSEFDAILRHGVDMILYAPQKLRLFSGCARKPSSRRVIAKAVLSRPMFAASVFAAKDFELVLVFIIPNITVFIF